MHSRRRIVVFFVEDMMGFVGRLKGEEATEDNQQFLVNQM